MQLRSRFLFNVVCVLILGLILVSVHFHDSVYRYDEIWLIETAQSSQPAYTTGLTLLRYWIHAFGTAEPVVRWLGELVFAISLSGIARLSRTLYGQATMWIAPAVLCVLAIVVEFGGRIALYTLPLIASASLSLLFWQMLGQPQRKKKFAYLVCTIFTALTYPVGLVIILLQMIFVTFTIPSNRRTQLLIWMVISALIGLVTAIIISWGNDNILLQMGNGLSHFIPLTHLLSDDRLQLLLLAGLAGVGISINWRQDPLRRMAYLIFMVSGLLVINTLFSDGQIQPNFLALLLPLFVILAANGLLVFNISVRAVITLISIVLAFTLIKVERIETPSYTKITRLIPAEAGVVIASGEVWRQTLPSFYIGQHNGMDNIFQVVSHFEANDAQFMAAAPNRIANSGDPVNIQHFMTWLQPYQEIWYIEDGQLNISQDFQNYLKQSFTPIGYIDWLGNSVSETDTRTATRYLRTPVDLKNLFNFGNQLWLQKWTLDNDVNAARCQTISVESWWKLGQSSQTNYSLALTLVDMNKGQGIVHADSALGGNETLLWQSGQIYFDTRSLTLPCDLATGDYPLLFAIHPANGDTNRLLSITQADGTPLSSQLYLTTLHIHDTQ